MFICLVEKTIAFGGVDIGIIKAQLAAKTTGKIIFTISKPESMAKVPSKGNNKKSGRSIARKFCKKRC